MSIQDTVRLFVRCKRCGTTFDTGRVVKAKDFEKGGIKGTEHTCTHCAEPGRYTKNDYISRATV